MRGLRGLGFGGLLACGVVAACGGDDAATASTGTTGAGTTAGTGGGGPVEVTCDGAPAELSLAGTWAAYGRLSLTLTGAPGGAITICPTDQVGEATLLLMITIDQSGATTLTGVTATLCSIELPVVTALIGNCDPQSASLVSTQIIAPQALLDALPQIVTTAVDGTLGGTQPGASVALDRFVVTIGSTKGAPDLPRWDTSAPACSSDVSLGRSTMCEMACVDDCAALRDDDADGYPGVTAEVCGKTPDQEQLPCNAANPNEPGVTVQGRAFLDIEVNPQFTGAAVSSCELEGTIDTDVLYNIVGADVYLVNSQISVASAIKSLPSFAVQAAQSSFRMVRVDGQYGAPDWGVDPSAPAAACGAILSHVNDF